MATDPDRPSKPRKWRPWAIALVVLAAVAIFSTWRATSLDGLPDVGDPFDVAAFEGQTVADDRNAFTIYRQAAKLLTKESPDFTHDWPTAGEAEKRWLDTNRAAMDLWRRGTERPDALDIPAFKMTLDTPLTHLMKLRTFSRGARLEATRLEALGDMDGALTWYLAMIRAGQHCGMRNLRVGRLVGLAIFEMASYRLVRWAADPRVDAKMLHRAIDAVLDAESMTRPPSESLKVEYLSLMNSIDDPKLMTPETFEYATGQSRMAKTGSPMAKTFREDIPKILKREPERSRRVIRLIFANQLAYCDLPSAQQPRRAETIPPGHLSPATPRTGSPAGTVPLLAKLYQPDASAPEAARAMHPAELAQWFDSTLYARLCLPDLVHFEKALVREQAARPALLATLRAELEKREHPQPIGASPDADRP